MTFQIPLGPARQLVGAATEPAPGGCRRLVTAPALRERTAGDLAGRLRHKSALATLHRVATPVAQPTPGPPRPARRVSHWLAKRALPGITCQSQ